MIIWGTILISSGMTTKVVGGEQKNSAIAQLITRETIVLEDKDIPAPVTVDSEFYLIYAIKNRIGPIICEVVPNSGVTKVYVDSKHYPVSNPDIAQKIGLVDLARIWQRNIGSPENLHKRQVRASERWKIYAQIEYKDAIVDAIPTGFGPEKLLVEALVDLIVKIIKETVSDPMTELRDSVAEKGFWEIQNNYLAAQKIAGDKIENPDVARKYLEHYWKAEAYERTVFSLLDGINEMHESKLERVRGYITNVAWGKITFNLSAFVKLVHEGKKATDLEWEYNDKRDTELRQVQEKLSKLYGATEYTLELAKGCGGPAIVSVKDGLATALVMDKSGSMSGEKIKRAKEAAYIYVNTSTEQQDLFSLAAFSSNAESITEPISIAEGRELLKKDILSLSAGGSTNVGSGLTIALSHLSSCNLEGKKAFLMSDGQHNTGTYKPEVTEFQNRGWPIWTMAFGRNADQEMLRWIAEQTGGMFLQANLSNIGSGYHKVNVQAHNGSVYRSYNDFIRTGEKLAYNIPVEPDMKKVGFFTNWQGSRMETILFTPSETVINRSNINNWGRFVEGETHSCYEIDNPQCGIWQALITGYDLPPGGEQINFHSFCQSDIFSNILSFQPNYSRNQKVQIGVKLAEVINGRLSPLRGAQVAAEIKKPSLSLNRFASDFKRKRLQPATLFEIFREVSGRAQKITLFDDGLHQDVLPGDGIYANTYTDTTINGPYLATIDCQVHTSQGMPVKRTLQESFQVGPIEQNSFTVSDFLDLVNQRGVGRQIPIYSPVYTPSTPKRTKGQEAQKLVESILNQLFKKKR